MNVLFILGRPAAGKTTVARRLRARIEARNPVVRIAMIDEYDILQERVRGLRPPAIKWHTHGTFELLDRTFLSKTALELEARALSYMRTHDLIVCELAHATYTDLFGTFGRRIRTSMQILYIHAPVELCRRRNNRRRHGKSRPFVPDLVLAKYYADDDAHELLARYHARSCILDNSEDNYNGLVSAVDEYVERNSECLTTTYQTKPEVGVL